MSDEPDRFVLAVANALCTTCADHCWNRLPAVVDAVRVELIAAELVARFGNAASGRSPDD